MAGGNEPLLSSSFSQADKEDSTNNHDGKNQSDKENGEKLPKTATNMYTYLLIGIVLITLASIFYFKMRKEAS